MIIKTVNDRGEIKQVLDAFSETLQSLSQGERFRNQMADKFAVNANVIVACEGNTVCGFASYYANDNATWNAYISMIAVLPPYRKKGVGLLLLNQITKHAKAREMKRIWLQVNKNNVPAIRFYQNNHFAVFRVSENSYYMEYIIEEYDDD